MSQPSATRVGDPQAAAEAESAALAAIGVGDHHGVYTAAKWWINAGGGAWVLDPWLLYIASGVLAGKPRIATQSADLALKTWIDAPIERTVLRWSRGAVVLRQLRDPKTAQFDLDAALDSPPAWLRDQAQADAENCRTLAATSRKTKPSVAPAPDYAPPRDRGFTSGALPGHVTGREPRVWAAVLPILTAERTG